MRRFLFILLLGIGIAPGLWAQQYMSAKDSDPEALALLRKAGEPFGRPVVQVSFTLKTTLPAQAPVSVSGMLYQNGKAYHLDVKDYQVISDGTLRWVYLKAANEVNLYGASQGQDWITPQDLLLLHKAPDMVFVNLGARKDGVTVIEAKPVQGRFEDYSKFSIHLKEGKLSYILALAKDGTRQEVTVGVPSFPASLDKKLFTFNPADHPGVHVEDLRLD